MRRGLLCILLIAGSLSFPNAFKRWTHPFRLAKCAIEWPHNPDWETPAPSDEICALLSQPFSYLTKGGQSSIFLSQDGKYVLKLFRYDTCRLPFGQILERKFRKWAKKEKHYIPTYEKIQKDFTSCHLAYQLAKEQTALVFIHLNPHKTNLPIIRVKDRLGRGYFVDPKRFRFILQKKAEPFLKTFYAHQNNLRPFVDSYICLVRELARLGLINLDPTIGRNFGFIDGKAVQIDVGNFKYLPDEAVEKSVYFEARLHRWLEKRISLDAR